MMGSSKIFKTNLLKLSLNNKFEDALTEWREVQYPKEFYKCTGQCLCQKTIKHITYMVNINTLKFIRVGSGCVKYIKGSDEPNKINTHTLKSDTKYGKLPTIENLDEYSKQVLKDIVDIHLKRLMNTNDLDTCINILKDIRPYIDMGLNMFEVVRHEAVDKINHIKATAILKPLLRQRIVNLNDATTQNNIITHFNYATYYKRTLSELKIVLSQIESLEECGITCLKVIKEKCQTLINKKEAYKQSMKLGKTTKINIEDIDFVD